MKRIMTVAVMCGTALASVVPTVAYADTIPTPIAEPANQDTLSAMQDQCDALAAVHDAGNGDIWTGEVVEGVVTLVAGPTEVPGTRVIDDGTIVGTGTFTPASTYIEGEPFRVGGSVNMFGDQWSDSGGWSDSEYWYTADFETTFSHAFSCNIYQEVYHPEEVIHHPAVGIYVIAGDFGDSEAAVRGNCAAFTAQGSNDPLPDWWGDPFHGGNPNNPHCMFEGEQAYDEVIPEFYDAPVLVGTEAGTAVNQDQTDSLYAFEDHGGPVQADGGPFHIGQTVICISPKKPTPGGTWQTHNGYTGVNCTTDWFVNHAVWGSGTESSNGTYTSVPDYSFY